MALTAKKVYAILKRQISDMEAKLNSPVRYRGTVATADLLPLNPDIGDMYNIESKSVYGESGMNVAWNGVVWDTMGAPIDMSLYLTKEEAESVIQRLVTEYLEKNPVKPGATTEQAQQIEQNKTDVASLKENVKYLSDSYVTPEMFGAVGDGVTDDTNAIIECIKYPKVVLTGGKKYLISKSIDLKNCFFTGIGIDSCEILTVSDIDYLISLDKSSGISGMTLEGNGKCKVGIKDNSDLSVKPKMFIKNVRVSHFLDKGIEYLNGWQAEIHDLYISGCDYGLYITGSDTTMHDINISSCNCGLYCSSGTIKINNLKIDNCISTLEENKYPLYFRSERGHLTNAEVQYSAPNGAFLSGDYLTVTGLILDGIGRGLTSDIIVPNGCALRFGTSCKKSNITAYLIRQQENTTDISVYNDKMDSLSGSSIDIKADRSTLFTQPEESQKIDVGGVEFLKNINAIDNINNLNTIPAGKKIRFRLRKEDFAIADFSTLIGISFKIEFKQINSKLAISVYNENTDVIKKTEYRYETGTQVSLSASFIDLTGINEIDIALLPNINEDLVLKSVDIILYTSNCKKKYAYTF